MAWYQNGTVNCTNLSPTIVGTTTQWVANVNVGNSFYGPDFREYEITGVTDDTHLTISPAYQGANSGAGAAYKIVPVQGYLRTTAATLAALVVAAGAFLNLTPNDKDIIQYNSTTYTTRTPLQYLLDQSNAITEQSIASAATTNIGTATTPKVQITGTNTITSFGTTPNCLRYVRFGAACLLTFNATSLILPYGLDMTTAAGDSAVFMSDASGNWRCMAYNYGSLSATLNTNAAVTQTLKNINTSTAARAALALGNSGSNSGQLWHNGVSFTTAGMARADGTALTGNGLGGISIYTTAIQPIYFGINSVQIAMLNAAGLGIGVTTAVNILDIRLDQSAATIISLFNNSSGTAAQSQLRLLNNVGATVGGLALFGSGFTATALNAADGLSLFSNGAGGISIVTSGAALPIRFGIGGVLKMTLTSTGLFVGSQSRSIKLSVANDSLGIGGTLDLDTTAGGASFAGNISACCAVAANANNRTQGVYAIEGRGVVFSTFTTLNTANGSGASFTLTMPSNGIVRLTNTSGAVIFASMSYDGTLGA